MVTLGDDGDANDSRIERKSRAKLVSDVSWHGALALQFQRNPNFLPDHWTLPKASERNISHGQQT